MRMIFLKPAQRDRVSLLSGTGYHFYLYIDSHYRLHYEIRKKIFDIHPFAHRGRRIELPEQDKVTLQLWGCFSI